MKQPTPLDYARHDIPVLPIFEPINNADGELACSCGRKPGADCSPAKHPRTDHGLSDASKDVPQVKAWMKQWPHCNWAMLTGAASGCIVLDVDPKHGGLPSMKDLTGSDVPGEAWGTTLIQRTGSGGYHLFFKHPDKLLKNRVGIRPGLDIRGDGGYVLVAPSGHISGGVYEWLKGKAWLNGSGPSPAPPMPKYLINVLAEREFASVLPDVIPEGERDHTMTSMAGTMRQRGMTGDAILAALRVENQARCRPPLDDFDLRRIANSSRSWTPDDLPPPPRNEMGNGQRLARRYGPDLRYSKGLVGSGWLFWNERFWERDEFGEIMRRAKLTALAIGDEAKGVEDQDERTAIFKFAGASQNLWKLKAMVELAQSEEPIYVRQGVFDTDPWLLNVLNGTVDLRTGELRNAKRSDLITKVCPVIYDANARCPTWDAFLKRIFKDDPVMIAFIQRLVGYVLTGVIREQKLFFLHGTGANGKTTLVETIAFILGDFVQRVPFSTFTEKFGNSSGPSPDIARMQGARMIVASEVDAGRRLAEALIKNLTGGDKITARFLNREFFEFYPQFKPFIFGNHKPPIRETDLGIWRRIVLIPFEVEIPKAEWGKGLEGRLKDEASGILRWALEGCLDWNHHGLGEPPKVLEATADYKAEQDVLALFLGERTEKVEGASVQANDLHMNYLAWCDQNNEPNSSKWTMREFGKRVAERGIEKKQSGGVFRYRGIQVRSDAKVSGAQPKF